MFRSEDNIIFESYSKVRVTNLDTRTYPQRSQLWPLIKELKLQMPETTDKLYNKVQDYIKINLKNSPGKGNILNNLADFRRARYGVEHVMAYLAKSAKAYDEIVFDTEKKTSKEHLRNRVNNLFDNIPLN